MIDNYLISSVTHTFCDAFILKKWSAISENITHIVYPKMMLVLSFQKITDISLLIWKRNLKSTNAMFHKQGTKYYNLKMSLCFSIFFLQSVSERKYLNYK